MSASSVQRLTPAERTERGRAARRATPPQSHAEFTPSPDRHSPVDVLEEQAKSRLPELVPVRHGRMLVSPFTYFRGAAAMMATDLASTPTSGVTVQLCGDAHLSNFGVFASPERRLLFDVNDFDETYPGPWEWDVKRLAASLVVAGRGNGFSRRQCRDVARTAVRRYCTTMSTFAEQRDLEVWYARADIDELRVRLGVKMNRRQRTTLSRTLEKARSRDSMRALDKLTTVVDGNRRIRPDPPLLVPIGDLLPDVERGELEGMLRTLLLGYRASLSSDRSRLFDGYDLVDMARKVVGVGSVGTRCWVVLLRGRDDGDPLFLQVKEAQRSVLADQVKPELDRHVPENEGERVVAGQRLMQATGDIFLGWQTAEGIDGQTRDFYVRQLWDSKGSAEVETMVPAGMSNYAQLCAWTLARAHARSGDRIAIAGYVGRGKAFSDAVTRFAELYADQNERDHAELVEAANAGRIPVQTGL
jgi:uncharacterized protein (DUF2252 family)